MSNKNKKKSIYKKSAKIKKPSNKAGIIRKLYQPPPSLLGVRPFGN